MADAPAEERIQIPPTIVKAVCAVMSEVEAVKKSQRNQHGNYQYSSTDDIYAAVAKKMGQVGLACIGMEDEIEIIVREGKDKALSQWLKAVYGFVLCTETETFQHPKMKRTVMVPVTGPQTFQAAQSYAEKSFLRSLFKLPTGDMDLDSLPENFEYSSVFNRQSVPPIPEPATPVVNQDLTPEQLMKEFIRALYSTTNAASASSVFDMYEDRIQIAVSKDEYNDMLKIYEQHVSNL